MAGARVDYIIRLLRDDSELKKQLKSTEQDISKLNAHERAEVKATLQARMDALTATTKAAKKNPGNTAITKEISEEANFIHEVLKEMQTLNPAEEWVKNGKVFAQTFTNMHKQLSDLTGNLQELKETISSLGSSFGNLGFDFIPKIDTSNITKQATKTVDGVGDVVVTRVHNISNAVKKEYNQATKFLNKLNTESKRKIDIGTSQDTLKRINALKAEYEYGKNEEYGATRRDAALAAQELLQIQKYAQSKGFVNINFGEGEIENFKNMVDEQTTYARQQIERYNEEVQKAHELDLADKITKNLKNLNIRLDLEPKAEFTKKVNKYIDDINNKNLHKIKVLFDDPQNLKKKKKVDSEQKTEDIVSGTGLAKFEEAIDKMQKKTLEKTNKWRTEMLNKLKFSSGDFSFNFGNALMDDLQTYFREPGHELEIFINEEELKRRIEGVVKGAGGMVLGGGSGGTATIDPKSMYDIMHAVFNGQPMPSLDTDTGLDKVDEQLDDTNDSSKKYVKTLSDTTIHIDKVINSLRNFAKIAGQSNASKGAMNVDTWLTDHGIDMSLIRAGADDSEITTMLQNALFTSDSMGHAKGSTIPDELSGLLKKNKIKIGTDPTKGAGKAIDVLREDLMELFKMLGVQTETTDEWTKRTQGISVYEDAAKHGRALATLNKFRPSLRIDKDGNRVGKAISENATVDDIGRIKVEDINKAINSFAAIGKDTTHLEMLRDARESLGNSTDPGDIKAFQDMVVNFYENTRSVFEYLNAKVGNFKGEVSVEGRKNPIAINTPKDFLQIPENAVIVGLKDYSDIGNANHTNSRGGRQVENKENRLAGQQSHQDKIERQSDLTYRDIDSIKVEKFKPQETSEVEVKFGQILESTVSRLSAIDSEMAENDKLLEQLEKQIKGSKTKLTKNKNIVNKTASSTRDPIYNTEYQKMVGEVLLKKDAATKTQQALKDNKGFANLSSYNNVIPEKILKQISLLESLPQEIDRAKKNLNYIRKHPSQEEADKFLKDNGKDGKYVYNDTYSKEANILLEERYELYKKIASIGIDKVEASLSKNISNLTGKNTRATNAINKWSQSTLDSNPAEMQNAQLKLKPLVKVFKEQLNAVADEILQLETKLKDPQLKGKAKDDLVATLQDKLQVFKSIDEEYANFGRVAGNVSSDILGKRKQKSVNKIYDEYVVNTPSILTQRKQNLNESQALNSELISKKSGLELKQKELQAEKESRENSKLRFETQQQLNQLKEQELRLQQEINGLEDGKKKTNKENKLKNVQNQITTLGNKLNDLGGPVTAESQDALSETKKKQYALNKATGYQLDIIAAHAQKDSIKSKLAEIDKWEKQVNTYGVVKGYGDRAYSDYKYNLVSDFRGKTRQNLKEQLGLNAPKFQADQASMSEEVIQERSKLYDILETKLDAIVNKFKESMSTERDKKGVLTATEYKWNQETDEITESSKITRDVKQHILKDLEVRKQALEGENKDRINKIEALINSLRTERDVALTYGGLEYTDVQNSDVVKEQLRYSQQIDDNRKEIARIEANDKLSDKDKAKKIKPLEDEIQKLQTLIANRKELLAVKAQEKEDYKNKTYTEEDQAKYTEKLIRAKERLKVVNTEISALEKEMRNAINKHGKDSTEALTAKFNYEKKLKTRDGILRSIEGHQKKLDYMGSHMQSGDTQSSATSAGTGGFVGSIVSAIKEGLSGVGSVDTENSDVATETTLRAIFELLSGGGQASLDLDAQKAMLKEERDAIRKETQEKVAQENKKKSTESESGRQSKTAKQKARLNEDGQAQFDKIRQAGSELNRELKELDEKSILGKMKEQVTKLKGMDKGTTEYLEEQYKLANTVFAYKNKLETKGITSGTRKDGTKYLDNKAVLERDEVKKLGDVKSLMVSSVKGITDELTKLGFGAGLGRNVKDPSKLDDDALVARFEQLNQIASEGTISEQQVTEFKKILALLESRGLIDDTEDGKDTEVDEEPSESEMTEILNAVNRMVERVSVLESQKGVSTDFDDDNRDVQTPDTDNIDTPQAQGGILGIMNELAKESTLAKVLTALGDIAKRNSTAGKANSAQDLLGQFQRMLERDAWEGRERVSYVDLATGAMSNEISGGKDGISAERLETLRSAYRNTMDLGAQVHTHANEDDPYFSEQDLSQFSSDFKNNVLSLKQILLSKNNMTVLDMNGVQDVSGLLDALSKTEQNFEDLAATASKFGAKYISQSFDTITPQGLVKMLGIKGIESKYTETETRDSAISGMLAEDAKEAADMLQESTGRAVKKTVERIGPELMTTVEKTDAKGNKTWSNQISDKYTKAALSTNTAFEKLGLAGQFGVGTEAQIALDDYKNKYSQFIDLVNRFKQDPKQDGLQEEFNKLLPELDEAETKLNKLIVAKDKFIGNKEPIAIFNNESLKNASGSLKDLAINRYASTLGVGDNMATNGISETPNGTRLLVDVLKNGTIQQYALEVDKATGQVKEFMVAETALANAFQNVNKAMKQNEYVVADVAIGDNPTQQQQFMSQAKSPEWNAYKKALADMEKYVANIWNRMANGGRGASQKELDYIMALSEKVLRLGKDVQKTSADFKNFWAQNPDNVTAMDIKIKTRGKNVPTRDEQVRAEMEKYAQINASANNSEYAFSSFDNDTLQYTLTDVEGNVRKVTLVWNELYKQVATISDKSVSALNPVVAKVEDYRNKLQQAVDNKFISENDNNVKGFSETTAKIQALIESVKNGTITLDEAKNNLAQLRQEALRYGEVATKTAKSNEKLYTGTNELRSTNRQRDKIVGLFGDGLSDSDSLGIKNYNAAYQELINLYDRLNKEKLLFDTKEQENLRQKAVQVQAIGSRLLTSIRQAEELRRLSEESGTYEDWRGNTHKLGGIKENLSTEETAVGNLKRTMVDYVKNGLGLADIEHVKFNNRTKQLTGSIRTSKDTVADIVVKYNEATNALYAYNKQERESLTGLRGVVQGFKSKLSSIMQYTASITSIYRVFGELKKGVQYVREIDSALTELKKVTEETEATYDKFLNTASKTAGKIGSTIKEVVSSTADFARLGYSMEDAATMAEAAQVLMNVSEFTDISTATDSLISSVQAFKYTATETMGVVDILNTIGKQNCRGYIVIYNRVDNVKRLKARDSSDRVKLILAHVETV